MSETYKVKLTMVFEGEVEAPTQELAEAAFNDKLFDSIHPTETWDITPSGHTDE